MTRRHALWPLQSLFWRMPPPFWTVGNRISDFRFWLYQRFGWEWV